MKSIQFEDQYLKKDGDGDLVLKQVPCAFLAADNYCLIYDVKPKVCTEFPNTDRKTSHQISDLTMQNIAVYSAAYNIVEKMKELMPLEHKSNRRA